MARKTILVVDDEKPQRDILQEILNDAGYDVTSAASGEAALKFAKERSFDLALTDLKMTGMDGIELLQQLLALDSSIIVILLTAHGTIDSAKDALRRGASITCRSPSNVMYCLAQSSGRWETSTKSTLRSFPHLQKWRRLRK